MTTQIDAIKKANKIMKEKKPYAVVYGYHIKRGINAKEVHEYLDTPIVCTTQEKLRALTNEYLTKKVTRSEPVKITGFDILFHEVEEESLEEKRVIKKSIRR